MMNSPSALPDSIAFIDLETTGGSAQYDKIIEIGIVTLDATGVQKWTTLVNPERNIPPFITTLTGISENLVRDAPRFHEIAPQLLTRLSGRLFVAHNVRFDYSFIRRELHDAGIDFNAKTLCTVKLSRMLFPEYPKHKLETLIQRFEISVSERHRALADAEVLHTLWMRWQQMLPPPSFERAVQSLLGRLTPPPSIDASMIEALPESPGAYALFNAEGACLKIHSTQNLRTQLITLGTKQSALAKKIARIEWQESVGPFGAELAALQFASKLKENTGSLCAWQLQKIDEGHYAPVLVFSDSIDFTQAQDLFGLYASRAQAREALTKLAKAYQLCTSLLGLEETPLGTPCSAFLEHACRGACRGQEALSMHSARLMMALAKYKMSPWPYPAAILVIEQDPLGIQEEKHLISRWRYLGRINSEDELASRLAEDHEPAFQPAYYYLFKKSLSKRKLKIIPLPRP